MARISLGLPLKVATALVCCQLIAGCAARPAVAVKFPGAQQEADAVHDWQLVARQIADEMTVRGLLPDPRNPTASRTPAEQQPYYIAVATPSPPFLHEVRQSLQSDILYRGGTVAQSPFGAQVIDLNADVVQFRSALWRHDGAPSTEVSWEASMHRDGRVIFDVRYPMYVSVLDASHYTPPPVGPSPVQLRYAP